jgi:hypothetical protein
MPLFSFLSSISLFTKQHGGPDEAGVLVMVMTMALPACEGGQL